MSSVVFMGGYLTCENVCEIGWQVIVFIFMEELQCSEIIEVINF